MEMTIKRHGSDEIVTLSPDVRDTHPAWVHEQMGTTSESELQAALDQYSADDCTGERDVCGIAMSDDMPTTKATHTPGPLKIGPRGNGRQELPIRRADGKEIGCVRGEGTLGDAHLWKAAPALLAACEAMLRGAGYESGQHEPGLRELSVPIAYFDAIRAAIAKAKP